MVHDVETTLNGSRLALNLHEAVSFWSNHWRRKSCLTSKGCTQSLKTSSKRASLVFGKLAYFRK